ncbi:hypothetical protein KAM338_29020 [Aeromonas caviae]|nr:hypothetical protein KAM330_31730 [Aeromonas hydrophila]GKQ62725.1 hypothetical protein KAM338_29020 [Aeromonas caviae]
MADTSGASGAKEGLNKSLAWDVGIHTDLHLGGVVISNAWYSTVSLQPLGESHRAAVAKLERPSHAIINAEEWSTCGLDAVDSQMLHEWSNRI